MDFTFMRLFYSESWRLRIELKGYVFDSLDGYVRATWGSASCPKKFKTCRLEEQTIKLTTFWPALPLITPRKTGQEWSLFDSYSSKSQDHLATENQRLLRGSYSCTETLFHQNLLDQPVALDKMNIYHTGRTGTVFLSAMLPAQMQSKWKDVCQISRFYYRDLSHCLCSCRHKYVEI